MTIVNNYPLIYKFIVLTDEGDMFSLNDSHYAFIYKNTASACKFWKGTVPMKHDYWGDLWIDQVWNKHESHCQIVGGRREW